VIVHNAIVHKLIKDVDTKKASYKPRDTAFDKTDESLVSFCIAIQKSYAAKSKATGRFNEDESIYGFQGELHTYFIEEGKSESAFLAFTKLAMNRLVASAKSQTKAAGGHTLFLHYEYNKNHYLMVLILSPKDVYNIEALDLKTLKAVDIDALRYAVRIDLNAWVSAKNEVENEKHPSYLNFLRGTAAKVADYFHEFIGCTDYSRAKESTNGMIDACRQYWADVKKLDTEKRRNMEKEIYSHCVGIAKSGEMIALNSIAGLVNPEKPEDFISYVNEREMYFPDYFHPDRSALNNRLKRYKYKSNNGWDLSFDHNLYGKGKNIVYNKADNTITIRKVPEDFSGAVDIDS
jgi:nucleoid-associated protein